MTQPGDAPVPKKAWWPRLLALALVAAGVAAFFALGLHRELTWENLKARRAELQAWVEGDLALAIVIYFVVYVVQTALSLPGATILTLAGGLVFGRWLGTLIVSFASTAGATLAFLLTRYLFRGWVQQRFGARLEPINRGIETDGAFYLFTLRLVPLFPFFIVNAVMGLTGIGVGTFWWVSQLGMLPATFIYVNAGTELGRIESPKDILAPGVVLSLVLIGLLPLLLRWTLRWVRRKSAEEPVTNSELR